MSIIMESPGQSKMFPQTPQATHEKQESDIQLAVEALCMLSEHKPVNNVVDTHPPDRSDFWAIVMGPQASRPKRPLTVDDEVQDERAPKRSRKTAARKYPRDGVSPHERPPYAMFNKIAQAILSTPREQMTGDEIVDYI